MASRQTPDSKLPKKGLQQSKIPRPVHQLTRKGTSLHYNSPKFLKINKPMICFSDSINLENISMDHSSTSNHLSLPNKCVKTGKSPRIVKPVPRYPSSIHKRRSVAKHSPMKKIAKSRIPIRMNFPRTLEEAIAFLEAQETKQINSLRATQQELIKLKAKRTTTTFVNEPRNNFEWEQQEHLAGSPSVVYLRPPAVRRGSF